MTTSKDVRDMLGLSGESLDGPRPKKKVKVAAPRLSGVSREVASLLGERAAPIPLAEPIVYQKKVEYRNEVINWNVQRFENQARNDGLLLSHWSKKVTPRNQVDENVDLPMLDAEQAELSSEDREKVERLAKSEALTLRRMDNRIVPEVETGEYPFAKLNKQVDIPSYDDDLYEAHLKSDDWSRAETDYLVQLYREYYGKWNLITDRWDFRPVENDETENEGDVGFQTLRDRSMEDLKARFYDVCAKLLAAKTPVSIMTSTEFELHDKMSKYDPARETQRKKVKAQLLIRSKEEQIEEEFLLGELKRIYLRQERTYHEAKDLRDRLDMKLTETNPHVPTYETSGEIMALFQKLLSRDKQFKARRPDGMVGASPSGAGLSSQGSAQKRASMNQNSTPGRRPLSPRYEQRYGVSKHDKLPSGVTFRSDRLTKLRTPKAQAQLVKVNTLLNELGVPELIQMPTNKVCDAMEKLMGKVNHLLEARKVREKEENELLVAKQQKVLNEGGAAEAPHDETTKEGQEARDQDQGQDISMTDGPEVAEAARGAVEADAEGEPDDGNEDGEEDEEEEEEDEEEDEEEEEDDEEVAELDEDDEEGGEEEDAEADLEEDNDIEEIEEEVEEAEEEDDDDDDEDEDDEEGGEDEEDAEEEDEETEVKDEPQPSREESPAASSVRSRNIRGQTRSTKRSVSVLSASSNGSGRSRAQSKRLKASRG